MLNSHMRPETAISSFRVCSTRALVAQPVEHLEHFGCPPAPPQNFATVMKFLTHDKQREPPIPRWFRAPSKMEVGGFQTRAPNKVRSRGSEQTDGGQRLAKCAGLRGNAVSMCQETLWRPIRPVRRVGARRKGFAAYKVSPKSDDWEVQKC